MNKYSFRVRNLYTQVVSINEGFSITLKRRVGDQVKIFRFGFKNMDDFEFFINELSEISLKEFVKQSYEKLETKEGKDETGNKV